LGALGTDPVPSGAGGLALTSASAEAVECGRGNVAPATAAARLRAPKAQRPHLVTAATAQRG
jgi:hypothetical protein